MTELSCTLGSTSGKEPTCTPGDVRDAGSIPGSERSPGGEHGNPFHYCCLENPQEERSLEATVHRVAKFSSFAQSCLTLCDPMNHSTPGLPVHHQLLEFTQTHVHQVGDTIQPSNPLSSLSPSAPNPSQHQSLFQLVNSLHDVAKALASFLPKDIQG